MAQQNKTRYAILGILAIQPASGYRIKQFCDVGIAYFWNENYGHLYPMLRQMAQTGEIEPEESAGSGRRSQRYRITEAGLTALHDWLDRPPEAAPARLELLLKLTFSMHGTPDQALRLVRDSQARHERRLAELEQKERDLLADGAAQSHPAFDFGYCTLRYGILDARFRLAWCDETIARLSCASKGLNDMDPDNVSLLASPMDWVNQIAGLQDSNALLGMAAVLDRPLPQATLRQAAGQLLRRHPILASRFIESESPTWVIPKSTVNPDAYLHEHASDASSVEERLAAVLESDDGGTFSVTQCHGPDGSACLVLGVRHSVTDGSGLKRLWADFLKACDGNKIAETTDMPAPTRQADILFESLGAPENWRPFVQTAEERQKAARSLLRPSVSARPPLNGSAGGPPARFRVALTSRTPDETAGLLSECRRNHATLTAWLAAELLSASPGRALQITVDLRRYLAEGMDFGLGNLSGTELAGFPDLPEDPGDRNPMAMLPLIGETLRTILAPLPGIGSACLQQSLSRLGYRKTREVLLAAGQAARQAGVAAPLLSNLGILPERTHIADIRIRSCFFLPPAFRPPAFMAGASTWSGCLSTCIVTDNRPPPGSG